MKKIRIVVFLLIMLLPMIVFADNYEYEIKIKVELENKDLENEEFSFQLLNSDNEVVQTTKNDEEGNVVFEPISFTNSDINMSGGDSNGFARPRSYGYKFYTVKQIVDDNEDYEYDEDVAYIGAYMYYDGTSEVHYIKDLDATIDGWKYKANRDESKIYHATEEDLAGQAYAVYDPNEKTLTFFRDEEGKYNNNTTVDGKIYYTNFESSTSNRPWANKSSEIKKVIFNGAIRPLTLESWFYMTSLEDIENINLLDTSLVTSMKYTFEYAKLTKLDLSTWDTSNVTTMNGMFYGCEGLVELNIDNFNTSKVKDFGYMFRYTAVKTIDASIFDVSSATNLQGMFYDVKNVEALDFSSWVHDDMPMGAMLVSDCVDIKFVDVTTIDKLGSNGIGMNPILTIVNLGGDYNYMTTGIGNYGYYWYNTKNETFYDYWTLRRLLEEDPVKTLEPATYVRPDNNPIPAVFINKYKVQEEVENATGLNENDETTGLIEEFKNPETSDIIMFIILLTIMSLGFGIYWYRKKDTY